MRNYVEVCHCNSMYNIVCKVFTLLSWCRKISFYNSLLVANDMKMMEAWRNVF